MNIIALHGFLNVGNTCYLSSCLQILLHTTDLTMTLMTKNPPNILKPEMHLLNEWKRMIVEQLQYNPHKNNNEAINPAKFLFILDKIGKINKKNFSCLEQNDITEILSFIIESFHICYKEGKRVIIKGNKTIQNNTDRCAFDCYHFLRKNYENDYSEIDILFKGIQMTQILSLNNNNNNNKQQILKNNPDFFTFLELIITKDTTSIYDCIQQYIKEEILENENAWFNEKTNQKESVRKRTIFWNFPPILMIHLHRISTTHSHTKNKQYIAFPIHQLNLTPFVSEYNKDKYKYDLYAVCNHHGSTSMSGHYTTTIKHSTNHKWYEYNDTFVTEINESQIITPNACCLFYRICKSTD